VTHRHGAGVARPGAGAVPLAPCQRIVTGVPIGMSRPRRRMAALRGRTHRCEIRPGMSSGLPVERQISLNHPMGGDRIELPTSCL